MPPYTVTMRFQHPAWDEVNGIQYQGIMATGRADAIKTARRLAGRDGHVATGKGRYWFTAEAEEVADAESTEAPKIAPAGEPHYF